MGEAVRSAGFWLLTAAFMLSGGVSVTVGVHFIPYLLEQGHDGTYAAGLAGLIGLMQLPGRMVFGPLSRVVGRGRLNAGLFAAQAGALLLLLGRPDPARLVVFAALFGMAGGVLTLVRALAVADLFGSAHYGSLSGMMAFGITLARAAGPTVAALLYSPARQYAVAFGVLAGVMVLAGAAYWLAERVVAGQGEAGAYSRSELRS